MTRPLSSPEEDDPNHKLPALSKAEIMEICVDIFGRSDAKHMLAVSGIQTEDEDQCFYITCKKPSVAHSFGRLLFKYDLSFDDSKWDFDPRRDLGPGETEDSVADEQAAWEGPESTARQLRSFGLDRFRDRLVKNKIVYARICVTTNTEEATSLTLSPHASRSFKLSRTCSCATTRLSCWRRKALVFSTPLTTTKSRLTGRPEQRLEARSTIRKQTDGKPVCMMVRPHEASTPTQMSEK
jgi:hypothetical protein